jgi:uncharacterized SAM-binding protein YcdF (DUF218 family)
MKANRRPYYLLTALLLILTVAIMLHERVLKAVGAYLIFDEKPIHADAVVVLHTGVEYYPRLLEAADLFRKGYAERVVINGNRKTDELRAIEAQGFEPCCSWDEDYLRILNLFGVPRLNVITVSAEDAYDTTSEAEAVGPELISRGIKTIILTTSKSHTRRAHFIWKKLLGDRLAVCSVAAHTDPYDPNGWWKQGRQIRWVLAEYGAWIFYCWKWWS